MQATANGGALAVVSWLRESLAAGDAWPNALLEAVGRWPLPQEELDDVRYQYLLLGEAFDWLNLAARLLSEVDGLVSAEEKDALLFQDRLPQEIAEAEFRDLIGPDKYRAHLNYFYGVVVEEALVLAVEEEIRKERLSNGLPKGEDDLTELAYQRLYGDSQHALLSAFQRELSRAESTSLSLTELKEFTYWLFKRRVNSSDSARIASDTKKGLERLFGLQRA